MSLCVRLSASPPGLHFPRLHSHACRQRELDEAAALAAYAAGGSRGGGSVSSRSSKRVAFGADDLLAALTWVVVQVRYIGGSTRKNKKLNRGPSGPFVSVCACVFESDCVSYVESAWSLGLNAEIMYGNCWFLTRVYRLAVVASCRYE